ncbi:glycosyl hydrolase [Whalleya microplaca]|nr:glycosyl hydrolase [Whalleya microplaca]
MFLGVFLNTMPMFRVPKLGDISLILTTLFSLSTAIPALPRQTQDDNKSCKNIFFGPLVERFPDPSLIYTDKVWYSFATGTNGKQGTWIEGAYSKDFETWTSLDGERIPDLPKANWTKQEGTNSVWAPDVMQRTDGEFLMYFAALDGSASGGRHCVGIARSDDISKTFSAEGLDAFVCNATHGGTIDPAFFRDHDEKDDNIAAYVVYKADGGRVGIPTELLIQQVDKDGKFEGIRKAKNSDGSTKDPVLLLRAESKDHNVEAPYIIRRGKTYFLFFSTHLYNEAAYDIQYATSDNVLGPYKRKSVALLTSDTAPYKEDCKLDGEKTYFFGPGGPSFQSIGDNKVVFHNYHSPANATGKRGLWTGTFEIKQDSEDGPTVVWTSS